VGGLLVTAERTCLLADNIESRRFMEEELIGLPIEPIEYPWHDPGAQAAAIERLVGAGRVGADAGAADVSIGDAVAAARRPLLPAEVARYELHGRSTTQITENICRAIEPGMTEDDVAAMLYERFARVNVRVPVCLIAADARIDARRHPICKGRPIEERVMVVVCAEAGGLWANLTRLVSFEPLDGERKIRHRAVCQVDATANAATRPGRAFSDIFADIVAEYDRQGFADEWQRHHQGGSTGYQGRVTFATPTCAAVAGVDQAFAWNPSITGTKCEDTMLVGEAGFEFLSQPGDDWPALEIERDGVTMRRADILVAG
jgi:Xaa-Pro aminopeptidase